MQKATNLIETGNLLFKFFVSSFLGNDILMGSGMCEVTAVVVGHGKVFNRQDVDNKSRGLFDIFQMNLFTNLENETKLLKPIS